MAGAGRPSAHRAGPGQAAHAARNLGAVDAIVSSDLVRASDTARIIAGALGVEPVHIEGGLRERDVGEWSGLTRADIHREWPGYLADDRRVAMGRQGAAKARRPPGWEADDHLLSRVGKALSSINRLVPDGDVLAITHGGVVYALELAHGAEPSRLSNLAGRWVEVTDDDVTLGERVALVAPEETVVIERDRI